MLLIVEQTFGFNIVKSIFVLLTFISQFVLIFTAWKAPIPYLLSNISIILGYSLDTYIIRKNYPTLNGFIEFVFVANLSTTAIAFGDVLAISIYENTVGQFGWYIGITKVIVPIITFISLGLYFMICVFITIKAKKDEDAFNT